jgi:hypothetical protein
MHSMKLLVAIVTAAALAGAGSLNACENCKLKAKGFYFGETTLLGNGTVYSWARMASKTKPISVGVTFTETALEGLQTERPPNNPLMPGYEHRMNLPKEADAVGIQGIAVDWNPKGHIPPGVYDVPHFDFHFYTVPTAQRDKITAVGTDKKKCFKPIAKAYQPDHYMLAPQSEVPTMGVHWVDVTAPEFNGKPFTSTFIYGSYNGKWIFFEPMVNKSFLETKPNVVLPIVPLKKVQKHAWYPTKYVVRYNEERKEYTVALTGFVYR